MSRVAAIILHAVPRAGAGPLESAFATARAANARRQAAGFEAAGAKARILETQSGGGPFGEQLRRIATATATRGAGIVVLGSGSIPLATAADRRVFVAAAAGGGAALTNNRYSGDILAVPSEVDLSALPDLATDNAVPRWLAEQGVQVRDLRGRWRLQVDLDSPIDVFLVGLARTHDPALHDQAFSPAHDPHDAVVVRARDAATRIRTRTEDPLAELLVAGRTSAASLRWLEQATESRTRALVEERGLRTAAPGQRPARSTLGLLIERDGPEGFGRLLAELADAALIDTRVLLAHRLGTDESDWPVAEDRFASDLLLHERIADPWLRTLTRAAAGAPIPVLLGGHTLVGPGLRLLLRAVRS